MIDKNKAYRFRGDSERWEHVLSYWMSCGDTHIDEPTFQHLLSRGILLEYPELPGEDWEFCEADGCDQAWHDDKGWCGYGAVKGSHIFCRKKKPVYPSGKIEVGCRIPFVANLPIYWTTDPEKGKELLS